MQMAKNSRRLVHDRDAAGEEELEDLPRYRRGTAGRLAHAPAEDRAHVLEELLVGLVERLLHRRGDLFAGKHHLAHLQAQRDRLLGALALLGRFGLDRAVSERVVISSISGALR